LGALAAACKQDDQRASTLGKVHAVPRTDVDLQFGYAFAYRRDVPRIPGRQSFDAGLDPGSALDVPQVVEPPAKRAVLRTSATIQL
jgi:hypothetical protein